MAGNNSIIVTRTGVYAKKLTDWGKQSQSQPVVTAEDIQLSQKRFLQEPPGIMCISNPQLITAEELGSCSSVKDVMVQTCGEQDDVRNVAKAAEAAFQAALCSFNKQLDGKLDTFKDEFTSHLLSCLDGQLRTSNQSAGSVDEVERSVTVDRPNVEICTYQDEEGQISKFYGPVDLKQELYSKSPPVTTIKALLKHLFQNNDLEIGKKFLEIHDKVKRQYPQAELFPRKENSLIMGYMQFHVVNNLNETWEKSKKKDIRLAFSDALRFFRKAAIRDGTLTVNDVENFTDPKKIKLTISPEPSLP